MKFQCGKKKPQTVRLRSDDSKKNLLSIPDRRRAKQYNIYSAVLEIGHFVCYLLIKVDRYSLLKSARMVKGKIYNNLSISP